MKTPSDELFRLIKSLDTQEKVHFKQYAGRKGGHANYIILFDAIDSQESYNEPSLRKKLGKQSLVKHFKQAKSYTTESILKALQDYHSSNLSAQISDLILTVELMHKKRLFGIATKLLTRAEELARQTHRYYYLAVILAMKREEIVARGDMEGIVHYRKIHYEEEVRCLDMIRNNIEYITLGMDIIRDTFSQFRVTEEKKKELQQILEHPLMQGEEHALSFLARIQYQRNLANICALLNRHAEGVLHYDRILTLMESQPVYLETKIESFLMAINNIIVMLMGLKKGEELGRYYEKANQTVKGIPGKRLTNSVFEVMMIIHTNYINNFLSVREYDKGVVLSEKLIPSMNKYAVLSSRLVFYSNLVLLYFYTRQFKKALWAVNEILNLKENVIRQDVFRINRMMNIFIHYELGNHSLLPALCRSTERYYERCGFLSESRKLLLRCLGRQGLSKMKDHERREEFKGLLAQLEKTLPYAPLFEEFNVIRWLEGKCV